MTCETRGKEESVSECEGCTFSCVVQLVAHTRTNKKDKFFEKKKGKNYEKMDWIKNTQKNIKSEIDKESKIKSDKKENEYVAVT